MGFTVIEKRSNTRNIPVVIRIIQRTGVASNILNTESLYRCKKVNYFFNFFIRLTGLGNVMQVDDGEK